ncbi:MAG: tRNA lysidine(34) synthetase TilS [Alphaproteobacteria bacterium]
MAASGGPDSGALLELLRRIRSRRPGAGLVVAAHFDHGLRGGASDRDALFTAASARAAGLPCVVGRMAAPPAPGANVEAAAREARYAFLRSVADALGAAICVAHTRDDQAETVLLRLARGAGPEALAAMAPRRLDGVARPLLDVGREELRRYARVRSLSSVVDATNLDPRRLRTRVRHDVLPRLSDVLGVDVTGRLARLADELRVESALAGIGIASVLDALDEPRRLPVAALTTDAAGRIVHAWLVRLGVRASRAQVESVVAASRSPRPAARVDLPGSARVERRYDVVELVEGPAESADWEPVELPVPGEVRAGARWRVLAGWRSGGDEETSADDAYRARIEAERVAFPLRVRRLRPGDRISLSRGHRKVARILVDAKVPRSSRVLLAAVVDAADAVVWVPGVAGAVRGGRGTRGDLGLVARFE